MKTARDVGKLVASLAIVYAAAAVGGAVTAPAIGTWYRSLAKPSFNPPNWVFGPAWTVLFTLMGIALFLVWRTSDSTAEVGSELSIFGVQLVLNVLWSVLFFGLKMPLAALVDIVLLWIAIILTIRSFVRVSRVAGLMLVPYAAWVAFAAALNLAVWRLN